MTYTVMADCLTEGEGSLVRFKFNFGAADTIMQLQINGRDPVRLVPGPYACEIRVLSTSAGGLKNRARTAILL